MGQKHLEKGLEPMVNSRWKKNKTKLKVITAIFIIIIYAAELFLYLRSPFKRNI